MRMEKFAHGDQFFTIWSQNFLTVGVMFPTVIHVPYRDCKSKAIPFFQNPDFEHIRFTGSSLPTDYGNPQD